MEKYKSRFKVNLYKVVENNMIMKEIICLEKRPNINDYQNYFAPKLSTYYAIHFFELKSDNHYKLIESWFKTKRGWKRV